MRSQAGNKDEGFSLIEVLVALAILSLAFAVLISAISRGLEASRRSEAEAGAAQVAQNLLATLGITDTVKLGDTRGTDSDRYSWRIHVEPFDGNVEYASRDIKAAKVTITVDWLDNEKSRSFTLSTLRFQPKS